ncbi:hypothetical protein LX36DRAFT_388095 [Colletotrichum falcatum]|nr:hypothetical protein LX36DRAFT_388095 [Colletotrichum falcatum]
MLGRLARKKKEDEKEKKKSISGQSQMLLPPPPPATRSSRCYTRQDPHGFADCFWGSQAASDDTSQPGRCGWSLNIPCTVGKTNDWLATRSVSVCLLLLLLLLLLVPIPPRAPGAPARSKTPDFGPVTCISHTMTYQFALLQACSPRPPHSSTTRPAGDAAPSRGPRK